MKFCVPTNWHNELPDVIEENNRCGEIEEAYGKLALDEVGGGRIGSALAYVTKKQAAEHIQALHKRGIQFNYLLNSLCLDNIEFTIPGQKKIRKLLDWILLIKADSVTVANPYLALFIKKRYPRLKLTVSAMAGVDTLRRAKFWENLGACRITFPGPFVNRNFRLIRLLRREFSGKIQLIANNGCIVNCPVYHSHMLAASHASQKWHFCRGYMFDYYILMCRLRRLENPDYFFASDWIRPEDVDFYEQLGVDSIKLVDRRMPVSILAKIFRAYAERSYAGNLFDLLPPYQGRMYNAHPGGLKKLFCLPGVFVMDLPRIWKLSRLFSRLDIYADNKQLDGFLENLPAECTQIECRKCGYCRQIADKLLKAERDYFSGLRKVYAEALEMIFRAGAKK